MLCFSTHHHTSQAVCHGLADQPYQSGSCRVYEMRRTGTAPSANGFGAAGSAVRAAVGSECADRTAAGSWREGYSGTL